MDKVSDYWKQLLSETMPRPYPGKLADLVKLNKDKEMKNKVVELSNLFRYLGEDQVKMFMSKPKYWRRNSEEHSSRIQLLL